MLLQQVFKKSSQKQIAFTNSQYTSWRKRANTERGWNIQVVRTATSAELLWMATSTNRKNAECKMPRCVLIYWQRRRINHRTTSINIGADFYVHVTVHRNKFHFNKINRRTNFANLFCQETLYVSGSSSAHHQEFSTVHSVLVYVMQVWWQLSSTTWSFLKTVIKPAWHIPVSNVQWKTPDDGQRNCSKHVEFLDKMNCEISASDGFINP